MPQKSIFIRPPLLNLQQAFPSAGLVRSGDAALLNLYQSALRFADSPACWEGLFRLACLVTEKPEESPVYRRIADSLADTESGALEGTTEEQIARARAGMALFEYAADRTVLKRLGKWFRYLEIEWDSFLGSGRTVYAPADLMELLVCFYRVSGMKAVLRLCSRLRTSAFDWTTALHTIQQAIPLRCGSEDPLPAILRKGKNEIEYDEKQILLNHAEMLADGIRYAHYAGEFSGHGQDLSAGAAAWSFLKKHHRAVCGGTTGNPYLSGTSSASPVDTRVLSAWAEAFSCCLSLPDTLWAADELTRLVYNGLYACLRQDCVPAYQLVNCVRTESIPSGDAETYARITRAAAAVFRHAVGTTEHGIRINYPLPARCAVSVDGKQMILSSDGEKTLFRSSAKAEMDLEVFLASAETAEPVLRKGDEEIPAAGIPENGLIRLEKPVTDGDTLFFRQTGRIRTEAAHHQGTVYWHRNRILCCPVEKTDQTFAAAGAPEFREGLPEIRVQKVHDWKTREGEFEDIPVLPHGSGKEQAVTMIAYDRAQGRIALFPGISAS